jgi:hypothetical protein
MSLESSEWWVFERVKITNITTEFSYIKYVPNEYTAPPVVGDNTRWVSLQIELERHTVQGLTDYEGDVKIGYPGNDDDSYFPTEAEFQDNWVGLTPLSSETRVNRELIENEGTTSLETHLRNLAQGIQSPFINNTIPEINDSSNLPKIKTTFDDQPDVAYFPGSYFDSIAASIYKSPVEESSKSWDVYQRSIETARRNSKHREKRYNLGTPPGNLVSANSGGILGVIVQRYAEGSTVPEFTKFIPGTGLNILSFEDKTVLYGKQYEYVVYPVSTLQGEENVYYPVILSNDYRVIVDTVELNDPEPPEIKSIEQIDTNLVRIQWRTVLDQVFYSTGEISNEMSYVDDIKGIQIFIRESLEDPYSLVKYLQYSDVQPQYRESPFEFIPREYIEDLETNGAPIRIPTSYDIRIRPNRDYYLALCSIDAHGNSSGYSAQYRIRRNSVTGEFTKEVVSYSHAPKVQPNLKLIKPIALSSFKASGYKMCTIYQNPDSGEVIPDEGLSLQVQMIDVQTDIFQTIDYNFSIDN